MPDIFEVLKQDHDDHRELLSKLAETHGDSEERRQLFSAFAVDAVSHAKAEEQSLYAEMLSDPQLSDEGSHSTAEHKEIEDYIEELQSTDMSSPHWLATFNKLDERYRHHINEEEEETFAAAKERFSQDKREELGSKFCERKPAEKEEQKAA